LASFFSALVFLPSTTESGAVVAGAGAGVGLAAAIAGLATGAAIDALTTGAGALLVPIALIFFAIAAGSTFLVASTSALAAEVLTLAGAVSCFGV